MDLLGSRLADRSGGRQYRRESFVLPERKSANEGRTRTFLESVFVLRTRSEQSKGACGLRPANSRFVVIDCETTGLGRRDRIVEIAVLTLESGGLEPIDEYDTLINPERDVGPTGVHGITASMVEAAPVFGEVAVAVARRINGATLVAHNLHFDTRVLAYEFARLGVHLDAGAGMCTLRATGDKLCVACTRFGIPLVEQHRALADARATAELVRQVTSDIRRGTVAAKVGHIAATLDPRTLQRERWRYSPLLPVTVEAEPVNAVETPRDHKLVNGLRCRGRTRARAVSPRPTLKGLCATKLKWAIPIPSVCVQERVGSCSPNVRRRPSRPWRNRCGTAATIRRRWRIS